MIADTGEDAIAYCPGSDYAANVELAEAVAPARPRGPATQPMQKVATPGKHTCDDVAEFLHMPLEQTVKSIVVMHEDEMVMLLVRGDHMLNEVKAAKLPGLRPLPLRDRRRDPRATAAPPG